MTVNNTKRSSILAAVAILLLIATGMYLTVVLGQKARLEDDIKDEKLTAESLLSQKLSLDKEIVKLQAEIVSLEEGNFGLNKTLNTTLYKLESTQKELSKAQQQGASAAQLKNKYQLLVASAKELEQQLAYYKNTVQELRTSHQDFESLVSFLQQENRDLANQLNMERLASLRGTSSEFLTRKGKLTVRARHAKTFIVEAEVPAGITNVSFVITNPSGTILTEHSGQLSIKPLTEQIPLASSASSGTVVLPAQQTIQMRYTSQVKLIPGIYTIEMLTESRSIGKVKMKLR
ncbi:MAG TPA: hypothetical protein VIN08_04800 [Ohtaekwangia sp.]|uniref:hypothetical protein n=1 Tax=Ohtaekwangia sp. TaxID=2066019 RepID=UPI002F925B09